MNIPSLPSRRPQGGFTLIELVMVMVIIAILAAVAIPKFVDLSTNAKDAAMSGVAGALSSASAVNYAARKVAVANGVAVANCQDVAGALQGGLPTGYSITAQAVAANVTVTTCVLNLAGYTPATAVNFSATGIP